MLLLDVALLMGHWAPPESDPGSPSPAQIPEIMLIALLMLIGATAFNRPHAGRDNGLGAAGVMLIVAAAGGDIMAGAGATMVLLLTYLIVWPLGLLLFGLAALSAKVYPKGCRFLPLAVAVAWWPGLVAGWLLPIGVDAAFAPVTMLLGITWVVFGIVLVKGYVPQEAVRKGVEGDRGEMDGDVAGVPR